MAQCPPETRVSTALCLSKFGNLLCVDRSWKDVVLRIIDILRNKLLKRDFDVVWLERDHGAPLFTSPDVRLRRLLTKHQVLDTLDETGRWWYNVQLHLYRFCQKKSYYSVPHHATYEDIFAICYSNCIAGYCRKELFPHFEGYCRRDSVLPHEGMLYQRVGSSLRLHDAFQELGFVKARDLGCCNLGRSVAEVLGTVLCMLRHDMYCAPSSKHLVVHLGGQYSSWCTLRAELAAGYCSSPPGGQCGCDSWFY